MSAVDLAVMRIPTRFVYVTAVAVVAGLVLATAVDGPARRLAGAQWVRRPSAGSSWCCT